MDFCQTFVIDASWDKDKLIRFWGEKIKVTLSRLRHLALYAAVEFRFLVTVKYSVSYSIFCL